MWPDPAEWFRLQPCPTCGPGTQQMHGNYPCRCGTRHSSRHCLACDGWAWLPERGERCGEIAMGTPDGGLTR